MGAVAEHCAERRGVVVRNGGTEFAPARVVVQPGQHVAGAWSPQTVGSPGVGVGAQPGR